jgi:hypothetical protein
MRISRARPAGIVDEVAVDDGPLFDIPASSGSMLHISGRKRGAGTGAGPWREETKFPAEARAVPSRGSEETAKFPAEARAVPSRASGETAKFPAARAVPSRGSEETAKSPAALATCNSFSYAISATPRDSEIRHPFEA